MSSVMSGVIPCQESVKSLCRLEDERMESNLRSQERVTNDIEEESLESLEDKKDEDNVETVEKSIEEQEKMEKKKVVEKDEKQEEEEKNRKRIEKDGNQDKEEKKLVEIDVKQKEEKKLVEIDVKQEEQEKKLAEIHVKQEEDKKLIQIDVKQDEKRKLVEIDVKHEDDNEGVQKPTLIKVDMSSAFNSFVVAKDSIKSTSSNSSQEIETSSSDSEGNDSDEAFQFLHKDECEFKEENFEGRLQMLCPLEYLKGQIAATKTAAIKSKRKGRKASISEMRVEVDMHPAVEEYLSSQRKLMKSMKKNFLCQCECFSTDVKKRYLQMFRKSKASCSIEKEVNICSAGSATDLGVNDSICVSAQLAYRNNVQNLIESDLDVSSSSDSA